MLTFWRLCSSRQLACESSTLMWCGGATTTSDSHPLTATSAVRPAAEQKRCFCNTAVRCAISVLLSRQPSNLSNHCLQNCAGVDMRDAHTALADATATLQVCQAVHESAPLLPSFGHIDNRAICGVSQSSSAVHKVSTTHLRAVLQVLLGQLRYFPALCATVPALHDLCTAPPKARTTPARAAGTMQEVLHRRTG